MADCDRCGKEDLPIGIYVRVPLLGKEKALFCPHCINEILEINRLEEMQQKLKDRIKERRFNIIDIRKGNIKGKVMTNFDRGTLAEYISINHIRSIEELITKANKDGFLMENVIEKKMC